MTDIYDIKDIIFIGFVNFWNIENLIIFVIFVLIIISILVHYFLNKTRISVKIENKNEKLQKIVELIKNLEIKDKEFYKNLNRELKKYLELNIKIRQIYAKTSKELSNEIEDKKIKEVLVEINNASYSQNSEDLEKRKLLKVKVLNNLM